MLFEIVRRRLLVKITLETLGIVGQRFELAIKRGIQPQR